MGAVVGNMTFLQLVTRLQQESGTSGAAKSTVVGATGEWKRLCDWIAQAYLDVQNARDDWNWMEADVVFNTIAGQQEYAPATTTFTTPSSVGLADFQRWKLTSTTGDSSFRIYLASAGTRNETFLDGSLSYTDFRDYYIFGSKRITSARPVSICVAPNRSLLLGLTPNDVFTVDGIYYKAPILMSADADYPAFPAKYHMLLVWYALEQYGYYEAAPEVVQRATKASKLLMKKLEDEQLPDIQLPQPLA